MRPYKSYGSTNIEWASEIPSHWEVQPIRALFNERKEKNFGPKTDFILSVMKDVGVIPYDEKGNVGNKKSENIENYKIVYPGDLVVNKMNAIIGSLGVSRYHGALSQVYFVLYPKDHCRNSYKYLGYIFKVKPFQQSLIKIAKGMMELRESIEYDEFKKLVLPIPPRDEQDRIVAFLDQKVAEIDAAIKKKERLIELLAEQKSLSIFNVVTKGLIIDVPLRDSGVSWIGEIPKHWNVTKLKYVSNRFMYGTSVECNSLSHGTPVLRIPNISESGLDFSNLKFANLSKNEVRRYSVNKNDILVVRTNGNPKIVGRSCLVAELSEEMLFASYLIKFSPRKLIFPSYLSVAMNSIYVRSYLSFMAQTSVGNYNLNIQSLGEANICIPPMDEQLAIVEHIARLEGEFNLVINNVRREVDLLKDLSASVIASSVSGKILL